MRPISGGGDERLSACDARYTDVSVPALSLRVTGSEQGYHTSIGSRLDSVTILCDVAFAV